MASNAPLTLAAAKRALHDLSCAPAERDPEAVTAAIRACYASDDYREGVAAIAEALPNGQQLPDCGWNSRGLMSTSETTEDIPPFPSVAPAYTLPTYPF